MQLRCRRQYTEIWGVINTAHNKNPPIGGFFINYYQVRVSHTHLSYCRHGNNCCHDGNSCQTLNLRLRSSTVVMITTIELSKKTCNHSLNTLYSSLRRQNLQSNSAIHKRNSWFFYARNKANSHLACRYTRIVQLCREGGSHTIPFVGKTARRSVRRF